MSNNFIYIHNCNETNTHQLKTYITNKFKYSDLCFRVVDILKNGDALLVCKSKKDQKELKHSKIRINASNNILYIPDKQQISSFKRQYKQQHGSSPNLNFNNQRRKSRKQKNSHKQQCEKQSKKQNQPFQRGSYQVNNENKVVFYYGNFVNNSNNNNNNNKIAKLQPLHQSNIENNHIYFDQKEGKIEEVSDDQNTATRDGNETINQTMSESIQSEKDKAEKQFEEQKIASANQENKYNWPLFEHKGKNKKYVENGTYNIFGHRFTETDAIRFWQHQNKYALEWFTFDYKISAQIDAKYEEYEQFGHDNIIYIGETNKVQQFNFENMLMNENEKIRSKIQLIGEIYRYGIIKFKGFAKMDIFIIYDRKNGYGYVKSEQHELFHPERIIEINDFVEFKIYSNKLEMGEDEYSFIITNNICNKSFIAYDIIKYELDNDNDIQNAEEWIDEQEQSIGIDDEIKHDEYNTEVTEITDVNVSSVESVNDCKQINEEKDEIIDVMEGGYEKYTYTSPMNNWFSYDLKCLLQFPKHCYTHKYYGTTIIEGLLLAKHIFYDENGSVGIIICNNNDKHTNGIINLLYHSSFFINPNELCELKPGEQIKFLIGRDYDETLETQPDYVINRGYDILYAYDITYNLRAPITQSIKYISRKCRGQIIQVFKDIDLAYIENNETKMASELRITNGKNCKYNNDNNNGEYRLYMYGRYNEKTYYENNEQGIYVTDFKIIPNPISYKNQNNKYFIGKYIHVLNEFNEKYKFQLIPMIIDGGQYLDLYIIIETIEIYFSLFLNHDGGQILFGVDRKGKIYGQKYMTRNKRKYIKKSIDERLKCFNPNGVHHAYFDISFGQVYDNYAFEIPDCYVIKITVAGCDVKNNEWFTTANKYYYTKKNIKYVVKDKILPCPPLQQHFRIN